MPNDKETAPTQQQVDNFLFLSPMLDSALSEMREFAKKKQDGIVSKTKIKILNRLLADIKAVLKHEASDSYLELLSEDDLPQNSDAVLVLGQYRAALDSFKTRNFRTVGYDRQWITKEWIDSRNEAEVEDDEDDSNVDQDEGTDEDESDTGDDEDERE